jgi:hypothetical protein
MKSRRRVNSAVMPLTATPKVDDLNDQKPSRDETPFLMVALATALSAFLPMTGLAGRSEAILIGWTVGFLVGYWIPPRPRVGFVAWMVEHLAFIGCFYLIILKAPTFLQRSLSVYAAYGIPIMVFIAAYVLWLRYPKSTLRRGGHNKSLDRSAGSVFRNLID